MARNDMKKRIIKLQFNAPVILLFTLLALGALIAGHFTNGWTTTKFFSVYRWDAMDICSYIRLFGHVLGHASWEHYMGNMVLLLVVGPSLEERYGSWTMLWCILFTALVTGIIHCVVDPSTALLGASGIVFMLIMLSSLAGMRDGAIPITLILVGILYLGGELVAAFTSQDSVSQLTHIVGGLCGTFLGFFLARRRR